MQPFSKKPIGGAGQAGTSSSRRAPSCPRPHPAAPGEDKARGHPRRRQEGWASPLPYKVTKTPAPSAWVPADAAEEECARLGRPGAAAASEGLAGPGTQGPLVRGEAQAAGCWWGQGALAPHLVFHPRKAEAGKG